VSEQGLRLLLVEDDLALAQMMEEFLALEGFEVTVFHHGDEAFRAIPQASWDIAVFDLMLPGHDGLSLCKQLRRNSDIPALILTAKDDDMVAAASLQLGVDNYLQKPIRPHLLLAHLQALLRRSQHSAALESSLQLDSQNYQATLHGEVLTLTSGEFELLEYLDQRRGQIIPRDELYQALRGIPFDGLDRSIDLRVSTVRKKLGDEKPPYRYIKTVRGKGYLLAVD